MSTETDQQSDAQRRRKSKKLYESVVRVVEDRAFTGDRPLAPRSQIGLFFTHSSISHDEGYQALQAAIANGDVLEWHGEFCPATEEALLEVIEWEASRKHPRKILIGKCNRLLAEARGERDE